MSTPAASREERIALQRSRRRELRDGMMITTAVSDGRVLEVRPATPTELGVGGPYWTRRVQA